MDTQRVKSLNLEHGEPQQNYLKCLTWKQKYVPAPPTPSAPEHIFRQQLKKLIRNTPNAQ